MRLHLKGSLVFSLLLTLFVVALLVTAQDYPEDVRLVPLVIGIPTVVLFTILLVGEFYPTLMQRMESTLEDLWGGQARGSGVKAVSQELTSWSSVIRVMSWAVAFFVLVFLLGFFLVPPVFVAAFLIREAEMRPVSAIIASIVASLGLLGGMTFLRVDLWMGAVPELIPGFVGGSIIPPI
ncbi:MAG: hypothetical protein ACE5JU_07210 [Candidatus Binatia bacterium]